MTSESRFLDDLATNGIRSFVSGWLLIVRNFPLQLFSLLYLLFPSLIHQLKSSFVKIHLKLFIDPAALAQVHAGAEHFNLTLQSLREQLDGCEV